MKNSYAFRREDDDAVVWVDFPTMMQQDTAGFITLGDGVRARRCSRLEKRKSRSRAPKVAPSKEIISDALGFGQGQLADFERDRKANHFSGVEFVPDPEVPQFYRVKCSSRKTWARYVRHRGMVDRNSTVGSALSREQLERAERFVRERHGPG